jgi:YVTN family beta-propeller protein
MEFAVLGPVAARREGRELPLGGPKQRALLAMLLLRANEVVSRDRLIDGLWGERPPPTAAHTLDTYIARLRKTLGDGRVSRRAPGYVLHVEPGELDLERFETLYERGREELAQGQAAAAAETLRSALGLWRGPALADVLYEPFARDEPERLEELRALALEERIEADLALGRSAELVTELERVVREHPLRERPLAQLMRALYRAGRQAEALAAFERGRRRLADELGLDPGPELRDLQRKILEHDPSLEATPPPPPLAGGGSALGRRRLAAAGIAAAAVVASVVIGIVLGTSRTGASSDTPASSRVVGLSLGSDKRPESISIDGVPRAMAAGPGSIWLADPSTGTVFRVGLDAGAVVDQVPVGRSAGALAVGGGSVWAAEVPGDVVLRIDVATGKVTQRVPLGSARAGALAFGDERLWIADVTQNSLIALDPVRGSVRRRIALSMRPTALALGDAVIWVADYRANSVAEVNLRNGRTVATIHVGNGPAAIAVGFGAVWVANALDSTLSRVDPVSGSVAATIPVGSAPTAVAVAGDSVWVANQYSESVSRVDPDRNAVVETATVGGAPTSLSVADRRIWVASPARAERRGGKLVLLHTRPISINPAVHVDLLPLVSDRLTRNGLVAYNQVPGAPGTQLVPDLAVSLPMPTDGGTVYTFRLRPGIRYSDGRPLRAADMRRAIERIFRMRSQNRALFANVVGAEDCVSAATCDLSQGIVTDETARTVSFRLSEPDPDFMETLAFHAAATPVPPGTPFRDTGLEPIPGTGPYKIDVASRREIRYVRNPFFREWSHAARPDGNPDEVVMRFGLDPAHEVREIQEGRADWMADFIPPSALPTLRTRFASQLHAVSIPTTDFFQFNTTLPPFDDVRVRRALNFAIDRRAIVRLYGGVELATPTCQVLAPGIQGYQRYCPYSRRPRLGVWPMPDLARARRLVEASGTKGTPVTVWGWTDDPTITPRVVPYVADLLRRLGYPSRVRLVPHSFLENPQPERFTKIQVIPAAWGNDTSYGFFSTWFACDGPNVHGWFCDRRIDRTILRAQALKSTQPRAAAALWAKIDRELVDQAAWVPLINEHGTEFVSARVRNYQFHPYWGFMADQVSLR